MEIIAIIIVAVALYFVQSLIYRYFAFKKLRYDCSFSRDEVYEGEKIELNETLSNYKWLPVPWVKTEITTSRWLDFAGNQAEVTHDARYVPSFFYARSYKRIRRSWNVVCEKRGVYSIDRVTVVASDLFGVGCGSMPVDVHTGVMVLPGTVDLGGMFISSRYLQGDNVVRRQLVTDPFRISGVREYSPSDPMKSIHWLSSAKTGRLMVKNEEYTTRQSLTVVLNMQSIRYEKFQVVEQERIENCIRVAATLLENTLESNMPVRLTANYSGKKEGHDCLDSGESWGQWHVMEQFRTLARMEMTSSLDFESYLEQYGPGMNSTDIAIVTSYLDEFIYDFARAKALDGINVTVYALSIPSAPIPDDCNVYLPMQKGGAGA